VNLSLILFYFLIILLPLQLARHFFFDFSLISGIRSDYLAPTIYLTDILISLIIITNLVTRIKNSKFKIKAKNKFWLISFIVIYLLFNSFLIAHNQGVAFYKSVKILEMILLGCAIVNLKPKTMTVIKLLSVPIFYSSSIAIWQFLSQKSISGALWWIGERSFNAGTPGIAAFSWGGRLILRPYATFPHPNVLGGFLATVLPLMLLVLLSSFQKTPKLLYGWLFLSFILGLAALFLSFSRAAWGISLVGFLMVIFWDKQIIINWLDSKKKTVLIIFYGLIFLSVVIPLSSPGANFLGGQSFIERADLIKATLLLVKSNFIFGTGLNNLIIQIRYFVPHLSSLYIFQPVHNIYLLVFGETGITGLLIFLTFLHISFQKSLKSSFATTFALILVFLLGLFDHYLLTLQQGQILLTVFISLAFLPKNEVN